MNFFNGDDAAETPPAVADTCRSAVCNSVAAIATERRPVMIGTAWRWSAGPCHARALPLQPTALRRSTVVVQASNGPANYGISPSADDLSMHELLATQDQNERRWREMGEKNLDRIKNERLG